MMMYEIEMPIIIFSSVEHYQYVQYEHCPTCRASAIPVILQVNRPVGARMKKSGAIDCFLM